MVRGARFARDSIVDDKQRQGANMNKAGFATVNPSTGEEIEAFSYFTPVQAEKVVVRADESFQSFRELPVHKRAQLFADLGNTLRKNKAQLARVISTEMGKILSEAEAEIEKCAHEADWYGRARTEDYGGRTRSYRDGQCVCLLSASWADPRDYAVEFSDPAAHTYGDPDDVGRQRCLGEALTYHAGSRLPGRCLSEFDS